MDCSVHKLVADVTLVAGNEVLLVRYRDTTRYDNQTGWFLPDDYLVHLEHPDAAARRIVNEQAGIESPELRLAEVESFNGDAWHIVFHYVGRLEQAPRVEPAGNVAEAEWFPLDGLPPRSEVGHHGWGLDTLSRVVSTLAA